MQLYESRDKNKNLILAIFTDTHIITSMLSNEKVRKIDGEAIAISLKLCESNQEIKDILENVGFRRILFKEIQKKKE